MCCGSYPILPAGIPIPHEVHILYSQELQDAWSTFDEWVQARRAAELSLSLDAMPENIRQAMDLICKTPIPTHEEDGSTGADSCYMRTVQAHMVD